MDFLSGGDADVTDALAAKAPRMLEIARQMRPGQERFKASDLFAIAEVLQPIAQDYFMRILGDDRKKEFFAVFSTDAFRVSLIRWLREPQNLSPSEYIALLKVCIVGVAKRVVEGTPSEAEGKEKDE